MKPLFCFIGMLIPIFSLQAQVVEDNFDDSNINVNPQWIGDTTAFIVNDLFQLQLNDSSQETASKYLSTIFETTSLYENEWRFDVRLDFPPSNANKLRFYLASNSPSLSVDAIEQGLFNSYFIEIGETGANDAISLFFQEGETTQLICRGIEGQFSSAFHYAIQVTLKDGEDWTIGVTESGFENYQQTATGKHEISFTPSSLGLRCFFTASRNKLFYFDNIYFGAPITDTIPPSILNAEIYNQQSISLHFSEPVFANYSNNLTHFLLQPGGLNPEELSIDGDSIFLSFSNDFVSGTAYQLLIAGLVDEQGNEMLPIDFRFTYILPQQAVKGDLIFSEFLPDPIPSIGLPESEFIEIFNRSDKYIDISNYFIKDQSSTYGKLPYFVIAPDSFLIICPANVATLYRQYGTTVSPNRWPSLNNGFDSLYLLTSDSTIIDELYYDSDFYEEGTEEGGYSLEIVNKTFSCFHPKNWSVSSNDAGGTPGQINSINNPTDLGPQPSLTSFQLLNEQQIVMVFDMPIQVNPSQEITVFINEEPIIIDYEISSRQLLLVLEHPLVSNTSYDLRVGGIASCNGAVLDDLMYNFVFDLSAPVPMAINFVADSVFLLTFNEAVFYGDSELIEYFSFEEPLPLSKVIWFSDRQLLFTIAGTFTRESNYQLIIDGITDAYGNIANNIVFDFLFTPPQKIAVRDLLLTELMIKPLADQVLPDSEYIEIYNNTENQVPLYGLYISDLRDTSHIPLTIMAPNEYIILCPKSKVALFDEGVHAVGVSPWPNLNNADDELSILNHQFEVINGLAYDDSWYRDAEKEEEGGWSLEMIDVENPCAGKPNWQASIDNSKGTPGKTNAVSQAYPDSFGPQLLTAMAVDVTTILLGFNETLLEQQFTNAHFEISPPVKIKEVLQVGSAKIQIVLEEPLVEKVLYKVNVNTIMDCIGNLVDPASNMAEFAVAEKAEPTEIIINEILFDPLSGGVDFIELYNRSDKYINLSHWKIMVNDKWVEVFADNIQLIGPYQFLVLTENKDQLIKNYPTSANADNIINQSFPNMPNEEGEIVIIDQDSITHEFFSYTDEMHLPFLKDTEGVSLERISPDAETTSSESWSSASSQVGYATPGSKNSQLNQDFTAFGKVRVSPPSFSPYLAGRNHTIIHYEVSDVGSIGDLKIYNKNGQLIKTLVNNETLSTSGFYRWDGDSDSGHLVSTGYYLVYFSIFDQAGNVKTIVEKVAVAAF